MSDYVLGSATEDGLFFTFICLLIIFLVGLCMICISICCKDPHLPCRKRIPLDLDYDSEEPSILEIDDGEPEPHSVPPDQLLSSGDGDIVMEAIDD